jgi:NTE family protein
MDGIVLALGGGGIRGAAHSAVLQLLQEENIPIAGIVGSSAGALAGAIFAFKLPIEPGDLLDALHDPEVERLRRNGTLDKMVRLVDFVRKPYLAEGSKLREGFQQVFGSLRLEDSPIPLAVQATDMYTGEPVVIRAGSVADAVRASSAIPSVFPPVQWLGHTLVDGDVSEKVPVTAAKALGLGPVVAVDVSNPLSKTEPKNALEAALLAGEASRKRLLSLAMAQADVSIQLLPEVPIDAFDYSRVDYIVQLGRERAQAQLPRIRALLPQPLAATERPTWWGWLRKGHEWGWLHKGHEAKKAAQQPQQARHN